MQFCAKALDGRISLARQEGVFDLGVEDGKPYFQAVGLGEEIQDDGTWVQQETWNTLCVTYDLSKVAIYLNGVKRLEAERAASGAPQSLTAAYRFGGVLQGYLGYVHIYERALTAEQVAADQLGGDANASGAALYLNFSLKVPTDQGKYKKTIRYQSEPIKKTALQVQDDGRAKPANGPEINRVLGSSSFTIMIRFYPLKSQTPVGFYKGMILFSNAPHNGANRLVLGTCHMEQAPNTTLLEIYRPNGDNSFGTFPYNEWATLTITYNAATKAFLVYKNGALYTTSTYTPNGVSPAEVSFGSARDDNAAGSNKNYPFDGYFNWLAVYDTALDAQSIAAHVETPPDVSSSNLVSLYSFEDNRAVDLKSGQPVALSGNAQLAVQSQQTIPVDQVCKPVNFVRALTIQGKGVAKAANSAEVCKVLSGGSFTIYAKVHKAGTAGTSVLFACMRDENYGVDLSIRKNGNSIGIGMYLGADGRSAPEKTIGNLDGWIDVAGVYDKQTKKLQYYVNGVPHYSYDGLTISDYTAEVEFGSKLDGQFPFGGCIDSVAIFDAALDATTIAGFEAAPPYLFNDHLAALYSFHDASPSELVGGSPISLQNGAAVEFCENTQSATVLGLEYNKQGEYEYNYGHVCMLAVVIDQCLSGLFGIPLIGYNMEADGKIVYGKAAELLRQIFCHVPQAIKLIDTRGDISEKEVAALLQVVLSSYQTQEILGIFCPQHAEYISSAAASWSGRAGSLLQAVAKQKLPAIQKIFKGATIPPYESICKMEMKSIHFAEDNAFTKESAKSRAIPVNPLTASVWTPTNTADAPSEAVYVASALGDTITVTVEFAYATNDGFERTLVLDAVSTGGCLILGNGKANLTVTTSGTYTAQVAFPSHGFGVSGGGGHYNPLVWSATVNGVPASISGADTTYHMLHLIGDFPAEPWDVTDPTKLPPLDGIRIVSIMIAKYGKDIGKLTPPLTAEKMATYATYWMHKNGYFRYESRYNPMPDFVASFQNETIYKVDFSFAFEKLQLMIEMQKVNKDSYFPIGDYDVSFLIAGAVRLCGYLLNVVHLSTREKEHGRALVDTFAQSLSDFPSCRIFDGYTESNNKTVSWFCANLLFSNQKGNTVGDHTESYYRECFFTKGKECYPTAILDKWIV